MAFVSETTSHGIFFVLHNSAEEAVDHLLSDLGSDYAETFWASDDGRQIIQSEKACPDFSCAVHASVEAAIGAQMGLDQEALPLVLRSMADAVELFENQER